MIHFKSKNEFTINLAKLIENNKTDQLNLHKGTPN